MASTTSTSCDEYSDIIGYIVRAIRLSGHEGSFATTLGESIANSTDAHNVRKVLLMSRVTERMVKVFLLLTRKDRLMLIRVG